MKNIYIYVSSSSTFMKSRAAPSKDLEIQGSSSIQNPPPQQKFNFFFPPLPPIDRFIASLFFQPVKFHRNQHVFGRGKSPVVSHSPEQKRNNEWLLAPSRPGITKRVTRDHGAKTGIGGQWALYLDGPINTSTD